MKIAGKSITFRKAYPARTYATASLAPTLHPDGNAGVLPRPLPVRGNDAPARADESGRIIDPPPVSGRISAGGSLPGYPTSLDTGLPPQRIRRRTRAIDRGAVGPGTNVGRTGPLGFNANSNGSSMTIPHTRIPRNPITVSPYRPTVDTRSSIPARGIGAPVK